MIDRHYQK